MRNTAKSSDSSKKQMSMLPDAAEDAMLANAESAKATRNRSGNSIIEQTDYSVIGEKQFKNPHLFPPPGSKGLDQPREIIFPVGADEIERSIRILGNNVTAGYTSNTLSVIAVINDMWKEQGSHPEGWVAGSYSEVTRRLGLSEDNPTRNRKLVKAELDRLKRCQLVFSHFHTGGDVKKNHEVTYFSEYYYEEDRRNPSKNVFKAQLHKFVLTNLRTGYIASLPLRALLQLKRDNSKPVLLRVDSVLAQVAAMEMSADTILDLLLLDKNSDWYRKPVTRRKTLSNIRDDLDGKELSSGWTVVVSLEKTSSGDSKLTFKRGERIEQYVNTATREIVNTDPLLVQSLVNEMSIAVGESDKEALYTMYARSYPEELIQRAISTYKSDKPKGTRNPGAFFATVLRNIVEAQGYAWIK